MTIDAPELDDRSFEELFDEAKKRLPAYEDGWTDYNPSDPGIILLELFAYLTDTYAYQLDTVTDEHRRKYLQLVGESPEPPEPATLRVSLSLPDGAGSARVPAGTQLAVLDRTDSRELFETTDDVVLTDVEIETVLTDHREGRTDHTLANRKEGMFYHAFGERAALGSAMYLGFDGDPFAGKDSLAVTVDFHDDDLPPTASHGDEDPQFYPSVSVVWEYCTDYESARRDEAWRRLSVTRDRTYAFYRGGRVTLARPDGWAPDEWGVDEHGILEEDPGPVWIRCRVLEGGYEIPPRFDSVRLNVVRASHRLTIENETLRRTDPNGDLSALTEQTYRFERAPVLEADLTVDGDAWTEVNDLDNSGPTDAHYVLDRAAGTVRFGDGINGRLPEPDATVVAERYVHGGGRDGNVPASSNLHFPNRETGIGGGLTLGDLSVTAASAGSGGADADSLEDAFRRVKRDLRTPYRTVTRDDYEYVATHTPGLRFGRATVLVESVPDTGADEDPVGVTVVVVPYAPLGQPRPEPSEGFLDAVQRHIDRHRLVTDRVTVEPPGYVDLSFDVDLQTAGWIPESRVQEAVESAINGYVNPNHGHEGEGWPFGRPLYSGEVAELLEGIDIVDHVREVSVTAQGDARADGDGNVLIDDSTLFALDEVRTDIRAGPVYEEEG